MPPKKSLSFSEHELTYLTVALQEYEKTLLTTEPDGWLEDLHMVQWLLKKIREAKQASESL